MLKKELVVNKIKKVLEESNLPNIGYIIVKINGKEVNGFFSEKDESFDIGLRKPMSNEDLTRILISEKVEVFGDFYGSGRTGYRIEELNFIF